MPAKSERQRRFLNWKFGHAWVKKHHFDQKGKLPERASEGKKQAARRGVRKALRHCRCSRE